MIVEVELTHENVDIDEATVSSWYVEEGEEVDQGDTLVEMIAGDEMFTINAPESGTVVELRADEEDVVKIGDVLLLLDVPEGIETDEDEDE